MKERRFDSMSAYKSISDLLAQTDKLIERSTSFSADIVKSAGFMRDIEASVKRASSVMPDFNDSAWHNNDLVHMHSAIAKALAIDYQKLPSLPQWILELNNPIDDAMERIFEAQNSWQGNIASILDFSRDFAEPANIFRDLAKASNSVTDVMKIQQSILMFDSNINEIYNLISWDHDEYAGIENGLTSAIADDIDAAFSDADKISLAYVAKYVLDTFNVMYGNYKTGKDKELFVKWITDSLDELKSSGIRVLSVKFLVFIVPFLFTVKEMLKEDKPANSTVIAEPAFSAATREVKFLKDKPDNRLKAKSTIPIGTALTILEDKGKWIKVKYISDGIFHSGWTLNSDLQVE